MHMYIYRYSYALFTFSVPIHADMTIITTGKDIKRRKIENVKINLSCSPTAHEQSLYNNGFVILKRFRSINHYILHYLVMKFQSL
jgi:hypothetical protein